MPHIFRQTSVVLLAAFLVGGSSALADLIAVDQDTGDLYTTSTVDASLTFLGSTGLEQLGSLEFFDGSLYGITSGSNDEADPANRPTLYKIDLNASQTGIESVEAVGELGLSLFEGGLAISPDGMAYGVNHDTVSAPGLFSINLATGAAVLIGVVSGGDHDVNGLSWRTDGMLIGLDRKSQSLLVINPTTAVAAILAPVEPSIGAIGGMVITENGGYFATAGPGYAPTLRGSNGLYSFDPFTGEVLDFVGNFNLPTAGSQEGISGLAIVPEPASIALLGLGTMALIRRRSRLN